MTNKKENKNEKKKKNEIDEKDIIFNYGIENLMEKDENLGEIVDELMKNEKYMECADLISYYLCEQQLNKQGKGGYFKFMTEGFGNYFRNDNSNEIDNKNEQNDENNNEKGN